MLGGWQVGFLGLGWVSGELAVMLNSLYKIQMMRRALLKHLGLAKIYFRILASLERCLST